ncbi:hypothetical protein [Hydrogenovibrio sp. SC-1]|nr:hypothetical protein [Hydrogenovibrio sp. SC-1]
MKNKKTWLGWVVALAIMGGGTYLGVNPAILSPVADSVAIAVQESTTLDD